MKKGLNVNNNNRQKELDGDDHDLNYHEKQFLYSEYKELFKENELESLQISSKNSEFTYNVYNLLSGDKLGSYDDRNKTNKKRVDLLHEERIENGERNYLAIIEKNNFEKLNLWTPKNICAKFWWKVMYCWCTVNTVSKTIINSPFFEATSIIVIVSNSIFLAFEIPGLETTQFQMTLEYVYLGLYTIEMVLKIFGMNFFMTKNSYLRDPWNVLDLIIVTSGY